MSSGMGDRLVSTVFCWGTPSTAPEVAGVITWTTDLGRFAIGTSAVRPLYAVFARRVSLSPRCKSPRCQAASERMMSHRG